jgi:hypothetical protein
MPEYHNPETAAPPDFKVVINPATGRPYPPNYLIGDVEYMAQINDYALAATRRRNAAVEAAARARRGQ